MKKFIVKKTGEPIKIGDKFVTEFKKEFSHGGFVFSRKEELITESNINDFINKGLIVEVKEEQKVNNQIIDINIYIKRIAKRLNLEVNTTYEYLDMMNKAGYKLAVLNMMLKEIAEVLNKQNILKFPEMWFIDAETGNIFPMKINNKPINITGFNTRESAELAKKICKSQLTFMGLK